jgi:hypothetical protein
MDGRDKGEVTENGSRPKSVKMQEVGDQSHRTSGVDPLGGVGNASSDERTENKES